MKRIVAAVVTHEDHYCLLRRSPRVECDSGLWHCVTGYLDPGLDPEQQVRLELFEELNAGSEQFVLSSVGAIQIEGWDIAVFRVAFLNRDVRINWEHDACEWVRGSDLGSYQTVWWLRDLIAIAG
ncbi:NUDIX domain-containing protein [Dietzia maris]